jgi:hypothetical protein
MDYKNLQVQKKISGYKNEGFKHLGRMQNRRLMKHAF